MYIYLLIKIHYIGKQDTLWKLIFSKAVTSWDCLIGW